MQNSDYDRANAVTMMDDPFERMTTEVHGRCSPTIANGLEGLLHEIFDPWVQMARQMAAGIKAHVEEGGQAGTHAYDLLAASETEHALTTETLIHMVAATVLHKLIAEEGGGRANITFSPADMDEMHRLYEMIVNRDGMTTTINLEPREKSVLKLSHDREGLLEVEAPAKPQAEARKPEPHWFAKIDGERRSAADRRSAEEAVREALARDDGVVAEVENRRCPQPKCPAPTHIDNCMATFCPNKQPK